MTYLLNAQGAEGNGASTPPPATPAVPDPSEGFRALLARSGNDAIRMAEKLYDDNFKLRQKNTTLKQSVPGDGAVVLKGDDAKKWEKYRALGEPAEVKASLDSGRDAATKLEAVGRAEGYRKVAEAAGYKPSVFARLAEQDGLSVELVEDAKSKGKDGKPVLVAVVKGEGETTTPLNEYVDQHWSDLKPALGGDQAKEKVAPATPPRRPFGMPAPAPDAGARNPLQEALVRTGAYSAL